MGGDGVCVVSWSGRRRNTLTERERERERERFVLLVCFRNFLSSLKLNFC